MWVAVYSGQSPVGQSLSWNHMIYKTEQNNKKTLIANSVILIYTNLFSIRDIKKLRIFFYLKQQSRWFPFRWVRLKLHSQQHNILYTLLLWLQSATVIMQPMNLNKRIIYLYLYLYDLMCYFIRKKFFCLKFS